MTFRDLEEQTNDALALFGNEDARGIVLLKPYAEYYDEYVERVAELDSSSRSASCGAEARPKCSSSSSGQSCDSGTS